MPAAGCIEVGCRAGGATGSVHVPCRQGAQEGSTDAACHGPIPQAQFLEGLGIRERLQALLEGAASDEEGEALISGYRRLIGGADAATSHAEVALHGGHCDSPYLACACMLSI